MGTENKFEVINLSCARQHEALFTNLSFSLKAGEVLFIEGANGSGKSSLLRLLTGVATPAMGDVFWQNKPIQSAAACFAEQLHYLGHTNGLKLGLTVIENLNLAAHLSTVTPFNFKSVLTDLSLTAHQHMQAKYLSAGQKRRVALAKLFLFPKTIWLLDEPLTALDANTQALFLERLNTHLQQGGIAVISSHHPIHLPHANTRTLRLSAC